MAKIQTGKHCQILPAGHPLAPDGEVIETVFFDDGGIKSEMTSVTALASYEAAKAEDRADLISAEKTAKGL
jgi:hypothetical protein